VPIILPSSQDFAGWPAQVRHAPQEIHMNSTHQSQSAAEALQSLGLRPGAWAIQGASRLAAARAGWLVVTEGRVWLTRDGGGDDHVLQAGERLWLRRGERVVVES
jgi:hypothetical protein